MEILIQDLLQNSLEDLKLFIDLIIAECDQKAGVPAVQGALCMLLMLPIPRLIQGDSTLQKQCEKSKSSAYLEIRIATLKLTRIPDFQTCLMAFVANAPDKLFPKVDRPQLLADPFMVIGVKWQRGFSSVESNVELAVQSLSGLFTLITEHGLQYPGYYEKLYEFTEPAILRKTLHCDGKERSLKLMRASLLSEDIPVLIVASFVKRLVRFGVHDGSISGTIFALQLAAELVVSHPPVRCIIHQPQQNGKLVEKFEAHQKNPLKSNALSSQLWELEALDKHAHPAVRAVVQLFSTPLDSPNITEQLQATEKVANLSIRAFMKGDLQELRKIRKIE